MRKVNFQVCTWKRAHEHSPEVPSPLDHGFHLNTETVKLEPLGFEGDVIPKALVDFLAGQEDDEDELHTNIEDKDDDDDDDDNDEEEAEEEKTD